MPRMNKNTFLWFDFETFGADPRRDRPSQFAARRTDLDLKPVGDAEYIYCQPARDVLPHPVACLITGITPQMALERGIPENEFALKIFELMSRPGTCSVGFNNFHFDDEVVRHLFWRNFIDPYKREWASGNSRFDLIDVLRMARALRPQGINWPDHDDGRPSFRLEDLAAANNLDVSRAHDALADVDNTIAMANLLRQNQPRLWRWALQLRDRNEASRLLAANRILLHASSRFPALPGCGVAPVLPLCPHPNYNTQWLVWNLNIDPNDFVDLDAEQLADRYWTPADSLPDGVTRVPVKLVRSNRCPMLAPVNVLDSRRAPDLGIELDRLESRADTLRRHPEFVRRLAQLFDSATTDFDSTDPEIDLYAGFPPNSDKIVMQRIHASDPDQLAALSHPFEDERLNEILLRYRARLWPDSLNAQERKEWENYRRRRLVDDPDLAGIRLPEYTRLVSELMQERPGQASVLEQLARWPAELGLAQV